MYSVFLVDDEPILLEGIRSKIDWESIGLNFVGEATDGEIALSMMQEIKPDILITDVKMPFMNGLELSSVSAAASFLLSFPENVNHTAVITKTTRRINANTVLFFCPASIRILSFIFRELPVIVVAESSISAGDFLRPIMDTSVLP